MNKSFVFKQTQNNELINAIESCYVTAQRTNVIIAQLIIRKDSIYKNANILYKQIQTTVIFNETKDTIHSNKELPIALGLNFKQEMNLIHRVKTIKVIFEYSKDSLGIKTIKYANFNLKKETHKYKGFVLH